MSSAYRRFLDVLEEHGCRNERALFCPAHDDHKPSLSVSPGDDGRVLVKCHAGCKIEDIVAALGLKLEDLFDPKPHEGKTPPFHITHEYSYKDEEGRLLFQVCRFDPKGFRLRRPNGNGGWIWDLEGTRRVLYRLPELLGRRDSVVYIAEGEKDADRLAGKDLVATTNPGGAGKWRNEYAEILGGRSVIILPDNDVPGREHAQQVARSLRGRARSLKIIELPGLPEKGDVSDWLDAGHSIEELEVLADAAEHWHLKETPTGDQPTDGNTEERGSQADRLVRLVEADGVELFHDELSGGFARLPVGDHWEVWPCRGHNFKGWLTRRFWHMESKAPHGQAISAALNVIEAKARFDGAEYPLYNRVAFHDDAIWYDLGDRDWRSVKITARRWEIVAKPPILFRRYAHQRPQCEPVRGGDLSELLTFVNLRDPSQGLLLLAYVVCCLIPGIPHPIPVLHGPQGSAKTTLFRILRELLDPSAVLVLSFPRDAVELVQQLSHHWAPFYDNVTSLPDWTSDMLCRAVTGDGFSKRELYSDDEDVIFQFRRCVGLNGINVAAQKPDLLDRCILFALEPIAPSERRPEDAIWREFEHARPRLLGAIFETLSRAMALRDSVSLSRLPRMADFALWGCAVAIALEQGGDAFVEAYAHNAQARDEEALHASPVAAMVRDLMEGRTMWEGTPTDLLTELEDLAEQHRVNTKASSWPKAPHVLSRRLNEVTPNLAAVGIEVASRREGRRRTITIRVAPEKSVTGVTTVTDEDATSDFTTVRDDGTLAESAEASQVASRLTPAACPRECRDDASDANDATSGIFPQLEP